MYQPQRAPANTVYCVTSFHAKDRRRISKTVATPPGRDFFFRGSRFMKEYFDCLGSVYGQFKVRLGLV